MLAEKNAAFFHEFLLVLFFAITATGSLLGFLEIYSPLLGISFSLLVTVLILRIFWKKERSIRVGNSPNGFPKFLSITLFVCGLTVLCILVLYPVARWPASHAGDWFPWDAGSYHFPKAVEPSFVT